MNLEKNMGNIFGHAFFAAAITSSLTYKNLSQYLH